MKTEPVKFSELLAMAKAETPKAEPKKVKPAKAEKEEMAKCYISGCSSHPVSQLVAVSLQNFKGHNISASVCHSCFFRLERAAYSRLWKAYAKSAFRVCLFLSAPGIVYYLSKLIF